MLQEGMQAPTFTLVDKNGKVVMERWFRCPIFSVKRWFYTFIRRTTRLDARGRRVALLQHTANLKRKTPSSSVSVKTAFLRTKNLRESIICLSFCCPIRNCRRFKHTVYGRRRNFIERQAWASSVQLSSLTSRAKL